MVVTYIPAAHHSEANKFDTYTRQKMPDFGRLEEIYDQEKI